MNHIYEIKLKEIAETTFENGTSWIEYEWKGKTGYILTEEYHEGDEEKAQAWLIDNLVEAVGKPSLEACSEYMAELIKNCRQSDNEMWFVEYEELEEEGFDLEALENEAEKLGLSFYFEFDNGDCAIAVFGGIITKFLF